MSVPALALAPVLIDTGTGASPRPLNTQLLDRATRPDYHAWLAQTATAGGCTRPVRLHGSIRDLDPATGEILRTLDTDTLPDGVLYVPCGDRRASVCPACAETYRADTYQLIKAGLTGGKGIPDTVAQHPCVFATFTAPSFGPVHTRRAAAQRPGRPMPAPPQSRPLPARSAPVLRAAAQRDGPVPGQAAVPRLLRLQRRRRLERARPRTVAPHHHRHPPPARQNRQGCRGREGRSSPTPRSRSSRPAAWSTSTPSSASTPPTPRASSPRLHCRPTSSPPRSPPPASTWFATVTHPTRPAGWDIRWGAQLDIRTVRIPGSGQDANIAVASYLAKYATKSTEAVGTVACRITADNLNHYGNPRSHQGRLIRAAWQLGSHTAPGFTALRRWAHMLGYRGHFATKSRRYSTTHQALRKARADYRRRHHPATHTGERGDQAVITITTLQWAGMGWRTTGDALLALSAAARARDHDQAVREELAVAS